MIIRGNIIEVMESWPLQLVVGAGGRRYDVGLTETTELTTEGRVTDSGELRPGAEIEVEGEPSGADETAMTATRIQIL